MSNGEEQTAVGDRAATDGHFITYQKIEEKEEEQQLQMLTRRELISWAISLDMPSYDSRLFRAVNGVDGAYRSPTANQKEKRGKTEKGKTSHDKCNKNFQLVRRSRSWFSLSVGNTS